MLPIKHSNYNIGQTFVSHAKNQSTDLHAGEALCRPADQAERMEPQFVKQSSALTENDFPDFYVHEDCLDFLNKAIADQWLTLDLAREIAQGYPNIFTAIHAVKYLIDPEVIAQRDELGEPQRSIGALFYKGTDFYNAQSIQMAQLFLAFCLKNRSLPSDYRAEITENLSTTDRYNNFYEMSAASLTRRLRNPSPQTSFTASTSAEIGSVDLPMHDFKLLMDKGAAAGYWSESAFAKVAGDKTEINAFVFLSALIDDDAVKNTQLTENGKKIIAALFHCCSEPVKRFAKTFLIKYAEQSDLPKSYQSDLTKYVKHYASDVSLLRKSVTSSTKPVKFLWNVDGLVSLNSSPPPSLSSSVITPLTKKL